MFRMFLAASFGVFAVAPCFAEAAESRCTDISVPKSAIEAHNGKWIELTAEQWEFLRGVFVLNPNTPPGLPFGDKAVLAQVSGDTGGLVFFIDGDRACTPMAAPRELITILRDVGAENIAHESGGL